MRRAWLSLIPLVICSCSGSSTPNGAGGTGGTGGAGDGGPAGWPDGGIHFTGGAGGGADAAGEPGGVLDAEPHAVLTIGTTYAVGLGTVELNQNAVGSIIVTNIGNASTGGIILRPSDSVSVSGCESTTLAPQAFCTVTITGNPSDALSWYGTVMIYAGPLDTSPLQVTVTARGIVPPTMIFSPTFINLHSILLGAPIPPQAITVGALEAITDLAITTRGPDLTLDPAGTTCGTALAAGSSCIIVAHVTATSTGDLRDAIVVSYGGASGPVFAVHVEGFVQVPPTLVITPSREQAFVTAPGQTSPAITLGVANVGEPATGRLAVALTGDDAADFKTTSDCLSLPALGTCTVTLAFNPFLTGTTTSRSAMVSVADTAPGGSQVTVGLSGIVSAPSVLAIYPETSDLGQATIGMASTATTFRVLNTGDVPLAALAVSLSNDEFVLVSDACTGASLVEGASCTLSVAFGPLSVGLRSGILTIATAGAQPAVKMLTGKGIASEVQFATPSAIDFDPVNVGRRSLPAAVLLKNGRPSSTGRLVFTMSGNVASFEVSENTCFRSLAPGEACSFNVTFAPEAVYALAAAITITDGRLSTSVRLTGWGYVLH